MERQEHPAKMARWDKDKAAAATAKAKVKPLANPNNKVSGVKSRASKEGFEVGAQTRKAQTSQVLAR